MKLTEFFRLRMPDGTDPVNIEDFNDNFEVIDKELKKRISSGESASDVTVEFEAAESRQPLKSGEKLSVLMGKAHRFFTDLKTVAFSGKYGDLSERPTLGGAAGYKVADNDTTNNSEFLATARVAYEHGLEIDALSRDLGGCSFEQDGVDFYIVGADAVRKKLTGNDIYEIAYNEGNGWAGKETIQLDVTNIPDYATLSLDSFKYVALLSSSGTGGATEEITGSYMGVKVLGYDSGSGKLSIQTANAYHPIFIVVIE